MHSCSDLKLLKKKKTIKCQHVQPYVYKIVVGSEFCWTWYGYWMEMNMLEGANEISYMVSKGAGSTSERDTFSCSNNFSTSPKTEPQAQKAYFGDLKNEIHGSVSKPAYKLCTTMWVAFLEISYRALSMHYIHHWQRIIKTSPEMI